MSTKKAKTHRWIISALIVALIIGTCAAEIIYADENINIDIDANNKGIAISETMYGLFYEDINHAADGGIYPELISNRSFEFKHIESDKANPAEGWYFNSGRLGEGSFEAETQNPLNENNPTYMNITITKAPYAIANNGYSGDTNPDMYITKSELYNLYFYARRIDFNGILTVYLEDAKGNICSDQLEFSLNGEGWIRYEGYLTGQNDTKGRVKIVCNGTGSFDLDFASLMPDDVWGKGDSNWKYGGLRKDLVEALKELNPGFIRFPGGCIVEGAYRHETRYNWKDTIGLPEHRKENPNIWGYMMSYGLGYHEYFQLCEDLGSEPVPVINAGILCQPRNNGSNTEADWKPGDKEFDALIQDYLDLIEYANGDITSEWGAKREENGHAESFGLKKIGIGNENWGDQYWKNFNVIKDAILAVYPEIEIITTTGPLASGGINDTAWAQINAFHRNVIADEHYYMEPEWFLQNTQRYDKYKRDSAKVFVGEYAAHEPVAGDRRPNTLYAALCEASYMTGLERNADIVVMASYAPLFARVLMFQWSPDMIWFNSKEITRITPSYYVQKLFSDYTGKQTVVVDLPETAEIFQTTSVDEKKIYTKIVNPYNAKKVITFSYENFDKIASNGRISILAGKKNDLDVTVDENEIIINEGKVKIELSPYSMAVLELEYGVNDLALLEETAENETLAARDDMNDAVINPDVSSVSDGEDNESTDNAPNNTTIVIILTACIIAAAIIIKIVRRGNHD